MADVTIADQTTTTTSALTDNIMIDRAGVNYKISFQTAILDRAYPIGAFYIQYPGGTDPNTAIGGTWLNDSSSFAGEFTRFEGGNALAYGAGTQLHAMQGHHTELTDTTGTLGTGGALRASTGAGGSTGVDAVTGAPYAVITAGDPITDGVHGTPLTANENRPTNKTARIWKRTA